MFSITYPKCDGLARQKVYIFAGINSSFAILHCRKTLEKKALATSPGLIFGQTGFAAGLSTPTGRTDFFVSIFPFGG